MPLQLKHLRPVSGRISRLLLPMDLNLLWRDVSELRYSIDNCADFQKFTGAVLER